MYNHDFDNDDLSAAKGIIIGFVLSALLTGSVYFWSTLLMEFIK